MVTLEDIIKRCKQYDVTAQRLLYERYANKMHSLCMRYISSRHEIKDIVHDGFIKIFSNIKQYKGKGSFEGWMVKIFINTTLTYLKQNKREHMFDLETIEYALTDTNSDSLLSDSEETITNDYLFIEQTNFTQEELLEIIHSIPESYRIIFNLYHIEGFKHEEIAKMLKIDANYSRTRLLRARNLIREKLVLRAKELLNAKPIQS